MSRHPSPVARSRSLWTAICGIVVATALMLGSSAVVVSAADAGLAPGNTADATGDAASNPTLHALGGALTPGLPKGVSASLPSLAQGLAVRPASVDLSAWAPPVGNQGQVGSCTSWATGYYYRYWLRNHATGERSTFAPMYVYSQLAQGVNKGTSYAANFGILISQGIARQSDYPQGSFDYTTQPTAAQRTAAAPYKSLSYQSLFSGAGGGDYRAVVEATISSGAPVLLTIPVYPNFDSASATNPLVGVPAAGTTSRGLHAVFAPRYDETGVWIENSWDTWWGKAGWAELSWAFINQYAVEGWSMSANDTVTPTPMPAPTPTPSPTANPTVCTVANPVVSVSPAALSITGRGRTGTVTVSVRNADGAGCPTKKVDVSVARTSGNTAYGASVSGATSLTLAPGATKTATLKLTASASAVSGTYATFTVTATKASEAGSGSGLFNAGLGTVPLPAARP